MIEEPEDELEIVSADELSEDDRAHTKKLNDLERREAEGSKFWSQVFAHPVGRREMWGILQATHAFEERFACGPNGFPQPEATWFHAGEQALGQRMFFSWQRLDPQGVLLMLQEYHPHFAKPKPPKRKRKTND